MIWGIRGFFDGPRPEEMPGWVVILMAGASTTLLGASVSAAMRTRAWPLLSLGASAALSALVVFGQLAVLNAAFLRTVPLGEAFRQAMDDRNPVFAGAVPAILLVAGVIGVTGLLRPRYENPP